MRKVWTSARVAQVATLLVLAAGWAPPAASQGNCSWYAETALKQQQRNEKGKCGFTGTSWTSDLKSHISWCGSVAPDVWKKEARQREQDLDTCAKK